MIRISGLMVLPAAPGKKVSNTADVGTMRALGDGGQFTDIRIEMIENENEKSIASLGRRREVGSDN
jgi:hypothetical protein